MVLSIRKPDRQLCADIRLEGSKSLSNRALIALALAGADGGDWLSNLAAASDTRVLLEALRQPGEHYDVGDAGTAFRFLTAYLALQPGEQILTGSARMQERPVGALVEALRRLGAEIDYLGREGFPPLRIRPIRPAAEAERPVPVRADVSSQFLSALLLIGPYVPGGLELAPQGPLISRPYVDMTLRLMRHFGARADWQGEHLVVAPGTYSPRPLTIEADWSAASYWYALAALAESCDLRLHGLSAGSWQGDAALAGLMEPFGVETAFKAEGIRLKRSGKGPPPLFEFDFSGVPDLAQTLAVLCSGLGVPAVLSGLETLTIKETDRIVALQAELAKVGVSLARLPQRFSRKSPGQTFYMLEGRAAWSVAPRFATHNDHRMALALTPLAMLGPIEIEDPEVVEKSYPGFWDHLEQAGFELKSI